MDMISKNFGRARYRPSFWEHLLSEMNIITIQMLTVQEIFLSFASWDKKLSEKDNIILSGRETWTTGAAENKNFHNFSGQFQYLHHLNEGESLYASVGQSFVLPTFSAMYNKANRPGISLVGDPNLKPEKGYTMNWDGKKRQRRGSIKQLSS